MGTEISGALGLDHAGDGGVAAEAGFAFAVVDGDTKGFAFDGVAGVGVGGVGAGDGVLEDFANSGVERFELVGGELIGGGCRWDFGVPEGFARVDVANAGDAGLIEEGRLDRGLGCG